MSKSPDYELQTLSKAVTLLKYLADQREPLGLGEISRALKLSKPSAHRILNTLANYDLVSQDAGTRKYTLGLQLWELGWASVNRLGLREAAHPWLERLVQEGGETALLSVLDLEQGEVVYIDKVDSTQPVVTYSRIGGRAPAFCTATGRAILAYEAPAAVAKILGPRLTRFTDKTTIAMNELQIELQRVRQRGWAVNREEWRPGVSSVSAPLWDHSGRVVAAIGLAGPAVRYTAEHIRHLAELLKQASNDISARLGYLPKQHSTPPGRSR